MFEIALPFSKQNCGLPVIFVLVLKSVFEEERVGKRDYLVHQVLLWNDLGVQRLRLEIKHPDSIDAQKGTPSSSAMILTFTGEALTTPPVGQ